MATYNPDDPDKRVHVLRRRAQQTTGSVVEEMQEEHEKELRELKKTSRAWQGMALLLAVILALVMLNQCQPTHSWWTSYERESR